MTAVEIVVLVVVVIALVAAVWLFGAGGGFYGGVSFGDRSTRGRWRSRAEKVNLDRDRDIASYSPYGGHRQDPPGLRKPPDEGGLL